MIKVQEPDRIAMSQPEWDTLRGCEVTPTRNRHPTSAPSPPSPRPEHRRGRQQWVVYAGAH